MTTTYSGAARAYADKQAPYHNMNCDCGACGARVAAFDAGAAHERATHTCPAEPERLTDPDDPRIFEDGALIEIRTVSAAWNPDYVKARIASERDTVYLLAEAPEPEPFHPDDAILEALDGMGYGGHILADLRDEGFDIVRAAR